MQYPLWIKSLEIKRISLVFFLTYAFVGSFQPVESSVCCDVTFPITSFTLDSENTCPALQKPFGISGCKTRVETLPVQSVGLLPLTSAKHGVHPKQQEKNIFLFASYYLLLAFLPEVRGLQRKKKRKKEFKITEMVFGVWEGKQSWRCKRRAPGARKNNFSFTKIKCKTNCIFHYCGF